MTKIVVRKEGRRFVPVDDDAMDVVAKIEDGTCFTADFKRPRSLDQLHKWWKLMTILAENLPTIADKRAASDLVLIACHEVDWRVNPRTGDATPIPRSIAFENMDEDAFLRLWQRAKFYISAEWLPIGGERLQAEVDDFFAGPEGRSLGKLARRGVSPSTVHGEAA